MLSHNRDAFAANSGTTTPGTTFRSAPTTCAPWVTWLMPTPFRYSSCPRRQPSQTQFHGRKYAPQGLRTDLAVDRDCRRRIMAVLGYPDGTHRLSSTYTLP